jgi:hypothetical protein
MRQRNEVVPRVESMEARDVPSFLSFGLFNPPVLTTHAIGQAGDAIESALGTVAQTHNFNVLSAQLAQISHRLPFGLRDLNPVLQADLNIYTPAIRGSGLVMQAQMLHDLNEYAVEGIANGEFIVTGHGSAFYYFAAGGFNSNNRFV